MNLVIFGPPGAGKGTQSSFITKKFKLYQLSTGELLREEIKNKTELGLRRLEFKGTLLRGPCSFDQQNDSEAS